MQGTGLGLALSKRLVEAMGGTINATSVVGTGTAFSIELPVVEAPVVRFEQTYQFHPIAAEHPKDTRTVLYIEDNLSNLRLIERVFAPRPQFELLTAMQAVSVWSLPTSIVRTSSFWTCTSPTCPEKMPSNSCERTRGRARSL